MNNPTIQAMLINGYTEKAFTHNYIFGFPYRGIIYMAYGTANDLPYITKLDRSSENQGYSLRFKPDMGQRQYLLPNAEPLCSVEYLESLFATSKYNRGDLFEKLVTEKFGQEWHKDNPDFTKAPDVVANGIPYQVKFYKATFTNEKTLASL